MTSFKSMLVKNAHITKLKKDYGDGTSRTSWWSSTLSYCISCHHINITMHNHHQVQHRDQQDYGDGHHQHFYVQRQFFIFFQNISEKYYSSENYSKKFRGSLKFLDARKFSEICWKNSWHFPFNLVISRKYNIKPKQLRKLFKPVEVLIRLKGTVAWDFRTLFWLYPIPSFTS